MVFLGLLFLFYRWGNWGSGNNCPILKDTLWGVRIRALLWLSLCLPPSFRQTQPSITCRQWMHYSRGNWSQTVRCSPQNSWFLPPPLLLLLGPFFIWIGFLFLHLLHTQITDESIDYTSHYSEQHLPNCPQTGTKQLVVNLLCNHCLWQWGRAVPVLILGKGKLSWENSWGLGKEGSAEPGRKEECWWWAEGGVLALVKGFGKGLILCQGIELFHIISRVSTEKLSRISF